jgi:hypothetical protein
MMSYEDLKKLTLEDIEDLLYEIEKQPDDASKQLRMRTLREEMQRREDLRDD